MVLRPQQDAQLQRGCSCLGSVDVVVVVASAAPILPGSRYQARIGRQRAAEHIRAQR